MQSVVVRWFPPTPNPPLIPSGCVISRGSTRALPWGEGEGAAPSLVRVVKPKVDGCKKLLRSSRAEMWRTREPGDGQATGFYICSPPRKWDQATTTSQMTLSPLGFRAYQGPHFGAQRQWLLLRACVRAVGRWWRCNRVEGGSLGTWFGSRIDGHPRCLSSRST